MRKTPILLIAVLFALSAQAATVALIPSSVYETTDTLVALDVNNYHGGSLVTRVQTSANGISSPENYTGWNTITASNIAEWNAGALATNVKSALFEFHYRAPLVTNSAIVPVTTVINNATTILNLTVLNDNTPPVINQVSPSGYVAPFAQNVTVNATDPETGVSSVVYTYSNCTGSATTLNLTRNGNLFTGLASFVGLVEGSRVCYTIVATNTPGESSNLSGQLTVDNTPPQVTLLAPTSFATETTTFSFTASDNIATTLTCALLFNGTTLETLTVPNATTINPTENLANFTEGATLWSARCTDGVGLSTASVQSIILDTHPPVINTSPSGYLLRTQNGTVSTLVTDTIGIAQVNASFEGTTVPLSQQASTYRATVNSNTLGTKTLTFTATDNAGHQSTKNVSLDVIPNHQLSLALLPSHVTPSATVTASGTVATDGALNATTVTLRTPTGNNTVSLINGTYSTTFTAPATLGNYTITVELRENGYVYATTQTLTVQTSVSESTSSDFSYSHGRGFPQRTPSSGSTTSSEVTSSDTPSSTPEPTNNAEPAKPTVSPQAYTPLAPEDARKAITPQATGIFGLGGTIGWVALFTALITLAAIGGYAYTRTKKEPEDKTINWGDKFK